MKRVASLYLPDWSIDRLRRIERSRAPSADAADRGRACPPGAEVGAGLDAIGAEAAVERAPHCSVPKEGGWRPGARWARAEATADAPVDGRPQVEAAIAALPAHRRPPQRELGRTSEAAEHPFGKGLSRPPEERVAIPAPLRELSRRTEAAEPLFRPGARGWSGEEIQGAIDGLPAHQRPSFQELSRRSEVVDNPFRASPRAGSPGEAGEMLAQRPAMPSLQFPGEDAPAKAGRGAALRAGAKRDRWRNEAPVASLTIAQAATMPPVQFPGEDMTARRAQRSPRRSARDGHGGEAGAIAPPSLARLAAMPSVQIPGEGPHPDNHGKSAPTGPSYGQGRFFQTGRTLGSVVARVCREDEARAGSTDVRDAEPPLVTTHKVGARVEIVAVNPAGRRLGLAPGFALSMARAQVRDLEVRAADPEGDAADLRRLAELLARRWSPIVAISDADGLLIDFTGVAHLHGGETRFAQRLVRLLARKGVAARVAVADTPGAAWALARDGAGATVQVIAPRAHSDAVSPLPVGLLRLDAASLELLARLGVDSVGQLLAMPRAPLVRRFGRAIVDRLDQLVGRAPEPLDPVAPPTRIGVERRFAEPIATAEAIEHWLRELVAELCPALARAGAGARDVQLVATRVDGVTQRLRVGFARPTRDPAHLLRLMLRRIEEIEPGFGVDALALRVGRADPLGPEALAPALAGDRPPDLAPLVDAIANRIGADRLWRARAVDSDVPERSVAWASPLEPIASDARPPRRDDVRLLDARPVDHPWHARWPRPVRLLRRPEQVDHVVAALPDQPPRRFTWRGISHRVVHAEGPERIAGEWWRRAPERRAIRDYFRVEDETGRRFWLFRRGDGVHGETGDLRWFLHGRGD